MAKLLRWTGPMTDTELLDLKLSRAQFLMAKHAHLKA